MILTVNGNCVQSALSIASSGYFAGASSNGGATYYASGISYSSALGIGGAVFNDYAEYRTFSGQRPLGGQVVIENGDDTVSVSTKRLQPAHNVCSDTFGIAIGERSDSTIPLAVSGRVLVYPFEERKKFKIGDCVCSAPDGKVSIMTQEEIENYPDCIVGFVSQIPTYETWGTDNVSVNGRIWIKVR